MSDYPLPNNACDLSGQVALVTGASSGLGWRFARVLASAGARVALTGRRTERLDALAEQIRQDGGEAASFRLDMTDMKEVVEVVVFRDGEEVRMNVPAGALGVFGRGVAPKPQGE